MSESFKIEKIGDLIRISNDTSFDCVISERPTLHRRRIKDTAIIKSGEFILFEEKFDLEKICIRFE